MKLLVTGGRDFKDKALLHRVLDLLRPTIVIHGAARGADTLAHEWAVERGVEAIPVRAPFAYMGPWAGKARNAHMLNNYAPDLVLACPGGDGTADCVYAAKLRGIPVLEIR